MDFYFGIDPFELELLGMGAQTSTPWLSLAGLSLTASLSACGMTKSFNQSKMLCCEFDIIDHSQ